MPTWQQFVMKLGALDADTVEALLLQAGAVSVTLSDAGDDPVLEPPPGATPLWSDVRLTALFDEQSDLTDLADRLARRLGAEQPLPHRIETLEDRAWEREWLRDFGPMQFGRRLWVCPTLHEVSDAGAVVVQLDPGLAFGTGTHATTALCLEWLDSQQLTGKTVLDYGCGSGVLAIAALKLGCKQAVAMDIDPQAVAATQQNAEANGVAECLQVVAAAQQISQSFDVVVANILAEPLVQFADSITSSLVDGGMLALSGVLCEQVAAVQQAYAATVEFEEPAHRTQDGQTWSRLTGKRRTA